jgi:hypothetical protein
MPKWAAIITGITAIIVPQAEAAHTSSRRSTHQFSKVTTKHVNARHQARLKLIREGWLDPHCPAAPRISGPARVHCFPNGAGRCCVFYGWSDEFQIPDSLSRHPANHRQTRTRFGLNLEDGLHWGYQQSARRSCCCRVALAACAGSDDGRSISYTADRGDANQPFPTDYRVNCWRS